MKQKDIKVGTSYLFSQTTIGHRKHLIGKTVKVIDKKSGNKKPIQANGGIGKAPIKYKLDCGGYANASELSQINI